MSEKSPALDVSLGAVGDIIWEHAPEARADIRELLIEAIDAAIDGDRPIWNLPQIALCTILWHRLLEPALRLGDLAAVLRAMEAMDGIISLDPSPYGVFMDALHHGVIDRIDSPAQRETMREAAPRIWERIERIFWPGAAR